MAKFDVFDFDDVDPGPFGKESKRPEFDVFKKRQKRKKKERQKARQVVSKHNRIYNDLCKEWDNLLDFRKSGIIYTKTTGVMVKTLGEGPSRLLARLIHKQKYHSEHKTLQEDGSFYYKVEEIAVELGTTRKSVSDWLGKLQRTKINGRVLLHVTHKDMPRKNYYRLDPKSVKALIALHWEEEDEDEDEEE